MHDNILRINMSDLTIADEKLVMEDRLLAGRALVAHLSDQEITATAAPLGPNNKLIITCGLLAGTTISCANRISIGGKSPLTGGIKEANAGGIAAHHMGKLGLRAIIVEGFREDDHWYVLVVDKHGTRLEEANHLCRLGIAAKAEQLYKQYGKQTALIVIGPAGEKKLLTANIAVSDKEGVVSRFSGRGGMGAVMGSKHLLAVVVDDRGCDKVPAVRPDELATKTREFHQLLLSTPQTAETFPKYGTAAMMEATNALGGLPTNNFSTGRFAGAEKLNGEALHKTITGRGGEGTPTHACMPGCLVRCSNVYPYPDGQENLRPMEYETLGLMGSNLGIDDMDVVAYMNRLCNDYGIDVIEVGAAVGVAMEGGLLSFGDKDGAMKLVDEIVADTALGRIIAAGSVVTGKVYGVYRVPAVKGQAMAAYEPRGIKGTGVTYATTAMGADHTAGNVARANLKHHLKEGQVAASRGSQIGVGVLDALGFCMMVGPAIKDRTILAEMLNARFGWELTAADLENLSRAMIRTEHGFNAKAGFTKADDRLPEYFYREVNPANSAVFDIEEEDLKEMVF